MLRLAKASVFLLVGMPWLLCLAQGSKTLTDAPAKTAERGLILTANGHCAEAVPLLRKSIRNVPDPDLKKKAGLAGLRCAMTRNQPYDAIEFLQVLGRDFPRDPEVLYQATHAYSDLSIRASQDLLHEAPFSYQVHELSAESLEVQGKWDDAAAEYRKILEIDPNLRGIHYRLGRVLLSHPNPTPELTQEAKLNFEKELKIDPQNAGAEYVLGELARQADQWPDAIDHFSRATKLDAGFAEAYLGLGSSLSSEKRFAEAVSPLETAVQLQPDNPVAHYDLAIALTRAGRKQDAEREFAIHRKIQEANPQAATPQKQY